MIVEVCIGLAAVLMFRLATKHPWAGILVAVAAIPTYLVRFHFSFIPTNAFEAMVAALAVAAISQPGCWAAWRAAWQRLAPAVKLSAGLFLLAAAVSTAISTSPWHSLGILKGWVIVPMLFAWLLYACQPSTRQKEQLLYVLTACAAVVSLAAFFMGPVAGRLSGVYDTPNSLALFVAPILSASLWHLLTSEKNHSVWLLPACVTQAAALLASQSLAGALAVITTLLLAASFWLRGKKQAYVLLGILAAIIIAGGVFWINGKIAYLLQPLTQPSIHTSATVRLQLWSISWDLIKARPLVGIGLGQFEPAYQQQLAGRLRACHPEAQPKDLGFGCNLLAPEFVFRDPHNWVLSFWLNTGLLGLGAFMSLNILAFRHIKKHSSHLLTPYSLLLTTILLFGLADTIYWKNDLAALWWLVIAALA